MDIVRKWEEDRAANRGLRIVVTARECGVCCSKAVSTTLASGSNGLTAVVDLWRLEAQHPPGPTRPVPRLLAVGRFYGGTSRFPPDPNAESISVTDNLQSSISR